MLTYLKKTLLALAGFLILSPSAMAQAEPDNDTQNVAFFTLDNGLDVLVITNHKIPAVAHMLWYKVGAMDEPPGKSGMAHFLEHLMFKETYNLVEGEFSRLVAHSGGHENAFTTQDATAYFQLITKEHLPLVMSLEAERMRYLKFNHETVENERKIVLEERRLRVENNPRSQLAEQMKASLFLNHPYGTPVIGWKHEITALSLEDLTNFYHSHYTPENAVLVISGDVEPAEVKELASLYYGSIPSSAIRGNAPGISPVLLEPRAVAARTVTMKNKQVTQPEWMRFYLAPSAVSQGNEHALPLVVLAYILGGGETSLLYQSLIVNSYLATDVGVYYNEVARGYSTFQLYVTPKDGVEMIQIEHAVDNIINRIRNTTIDEETLERAKIWLAAQATYAKDGLQNIANIYGEVITSGLSPDHIKQWDRNIMDVSQDDLMEAAEYTLKAERSVTGTLRKTE